jgi:hypothetical protein
MSTGGNDCHLRAEADGCIAVLARPIAAAMLAEDGLPRLSAFRAR